VTEPKAEPDPLRDWMTLRGAEGLVELVRAYWRGQSYPELKVWVEVVRGDREPLVVIKSGLRGGLPPPSNE
jgi:hypothetical protein